MSNATISIADKSVVENDNAQDLKPIEENKSLFDTLAALEEERITWEEGAYRTSNKALYAVLAKCLAIAQPGTPELAKQRNAELEAFYESPRVSWRPVGLS